jgi:hypothetical protein
MKCNLPQWGRPPRSDNVGAPKKTLYNFSTNVANKGVRSNGFLTFCDKLGVGDSLVKGASYLMHLDDFSDVRNFLLAHSNMILQDDTGVPIRFLDSSWKLQPFGSTSGQSECLRVSHSPTCSSFSANKSPAN